MIKRALLVLSLLLAGQLNGKTFPDGWVEAKRALLKDLEGAPLSEQIEKLSRPLTELGFNTKHGYTDKEEQELYKTIQERLVAIPGHAEYLGQNVRKWKKRALEDPRFYYDYTRKAGKAFNTLRYLPSSESVRVAASFLDDDYTRYDSDGMEYGRKNSRSAYHILENLVADPPVPPGVPASISVWREWRDEVKAGKRTFAIKGVAGRYDFKGPVMRRDRPPKPGTRQPSASGRLPAQSPGSEQSGGAGSAAPSRALRYALWSAALLLALSLAWFAFSKNRSRR